MMDIVSVSGLIIGLVGIVGGMILEGGHVGSIVQGTAAFIVLGGTAGAVLVSTTQHDLAKGLSLFKLGFGNDLEAESTDKIIEEVVEAATIVRRDSILALENHLPKLSSPFMKDLLRLVIDGADPSMVREIGETKIQLEEDDLLAGAKIYTDAGGYSPTIGIIGAVLGLIHVMSNLTDTSKLGPGIAVAFVATVYGVGAANLLFLPLGAKIKRKVIKRMESRQMVVEGVVAIASGLSPFLVGEKIKGYVPDSAKNNKGQAA
jgi:chemotaxis protein MotA